MTKTTNQNPRVELARAWYNSLITSAVLEHGVVVWRTLTRAFLQLYRLESPILCKLSLVCSSLFFRLKRRADCLMVGVRVLCNRVAVTIAAVLLDDELNLNLLCYFHSVFNDRSTRSTPIIAFGTFLKWLNKAIKAVFTAQPRQKFRGLDTNQAIFSTIFTGRNYKRWLNVGRYPQLFSPHKGINK